MKPHPDSTPDFAALHRRICECAAVPLTDLVRRRRLRQVVRRGTLAALPAIASGLILLPEGGHTRTPATDAVVENALEAWTEGDDLDRVLQILAQGE